MHCHLAFGLVFTVKYNSGSKEMKASQKIKSTVAGAHSIFYLQKTILTRDKNIHFDVTLTALYNEQCQLLFTWHNNFDYLIPTCPAICF